ncbi:formate/nitrite transporter family protein [Winogradskyella maritima]|uniref:Formate/nitrite transporter family protein n=1 Tax=Winogradskyella maritima TaxID=1517766 RepID=A0ABV8AIP8_9FLAO
MKTQFLNISRVSAEMYKETKHNIEISSITRIFILALLGGSFITFGALFSVLISAGVETLGTKLLLQGLGFSVGFFIVIMTGALLFSETNVVLPTSILNCTRRELVSNVFKFWGVTILGNVTGALTVGWLINFAHVYPEEVQTELFHLIEKKMYYAEVGTTLSWFKALVSGMFGNMLIGIAAILALMGRTIIGKYIPVFLSVSLFVAANFQHSPANMGYFSIAIPMGQGTAWADAIMWNILPAALGNILGGTLLVALPLYYVFAEKNEMQEENNDEL